MNKMKEKWMCIVLILAFLLIQVVIGGLLVWGENVLVDTIIDVVVLICVLITILLSFLFVHLAKKIDMQEQFRLSLLLRVLCIALIASSVIFMFLFFVYSFIS